MTQTLSGADIRGYYAALGIPIPDWAGCEAAVRCFAAPDSHRRGDRDPSCSVNLDHGAFHCHGCGAKGGAYDAATVRGYQPRDAIDLMVAHGLTQPRVPRHHRPVRPAARATSQTRQTSREQPAFTVTEHDLIIWQGALAADRRLLTRLGQERGWTYDVIQELGLGLDRGRITIPTRDANGELNGLLRYRPWPRPGERKLTAAPGSQRTLLPYPAAEPAESIVLVEGEPDMIAARSHGLAAIAVPGVDSWRSEWAPLFGKREVTVIADADPQGRSLAARIVQDLGPQTVVHDLAPDRDDGYDLTDWLVGCRSAEDPWLTAGEVASELRLTPATIRAWITNGNLPAKRAGKRKWLISRSELELFLSLTRGSPSTGAIESDGRTHG